MKQHSKQRRRFSQNDCFNSNIDGFPVTDSIMNVDKVEFMFRGKYHNDIMVFEPMIRHTSFIFE